MASITRIVISRNVYGMYVDYHNEPYYSSNITEIIWKAGELDANYLNNYPNLVVLTCENNGITTLEPLKQLINKDYLIMLNCRNNQLTSLNGIEKCIQLASLDCSNNKLTLLDSILQLKKLNTLRYSGNPLAVPTIDVIKMLNNTNTIDNSNNYNNTESIKYQFNGNSIKKDSEIFLQITLLVKTF